MSAVFARGALGDVSSLIADASLREPCNKELDVM